MTSLVSRTARIVLAVLTLSGGALITMDAPAEADAPLVTIDTHGASTNGAKAYLTASPGSEVRAAFTFTAQSHVQFRAKDNFVGSPDYRISSESTCSLRGATFLPAGESCDVVLRFGFDEFPAYTIAFATVPYFALPTDEFGAPLPGAIEEARRQAVVFYPNPFAVTTADFGETEIGTTATRNIRVTNAYSPTPYGFTMHLQAGPFAVAAGIHGLEPGESIEIPVTFTPTLLGEAIGSPVPAYTAMNTGTLLLDPFARLSGIGTAPAITLTGEDIRFGDVDIATQGTQDLTLSNTGATDTTVSISNRFELDASGISVSLEDGTALRAGETLSTPVTWTPESAGAIPADSIEITHAPWVDPAGTHGPLAPISLQVTGTAVSPAPAVQVSQLDFGTVPVGERRVERLTFTSTADHPITLTLNPGSLSSGLTTAATVVVPAGESVSPEITWSPTSSGTLSAHLSFTDLASDTTVLAEVSGTAVKPAVNPDPTDGADPDGALPATPETPRSQRTEAATLAATGSVEPTVAVLMALGLLQLGLGAFALTRHRARRQRTSAAAV
ncbi:choice-of-anchor D domain-containing protein [Leucobacter luti]|uniref:choice-of-anchor D domain-containing protein n=1 Tax=Leucobacter luti TaxID=340320 RepID=UPI001C68E8D2|nr:choice-of-anchor D domain-containing protein [Leucobacter luti]QYM76833.1 choice-of-anchor D domain-containing protein [Leucobacter luti]